MVLPPARKARESPPLQAHVKAILLDIEGTTTPIDFVAKVLFPHARHQLEPFLRRRWSDADVRADLELLRQEHAWDVEQGLNPPPLESVKSIESVVSHVGWLMDQDRKSTGLKSLQGKIWEAGYRSGELHGEVYDDVPRAFARWRRQGRDIAIFSSGSVLAQKLLFASTPAGDLTRFIRAYFDTTTGPKREAESYRLISAALDLAPAEVLFVSDITAELDAARAAGLQTALSVRPGQPDPEMPAHEVIHSLDRVFP